MMVLSLTEALVPSETEKLKKISEPVSAPRTSDPSGSGSFSREHCDLRGLGQLLDDLGFVVSVVDPGLPEFSGVAVLLPVVVPVSSAVSPETEHVDLRGRRREDQTGTLSKNSTKNLVPGGLTSSQTCRAKNRTSMPVEGYRPWCLVQRSWMYLKKAGLKIWT